MRRQPLNRNLTPRRCHLSPTCPPASPTLTTRAKHAQLEGVQAALTLDDVVECEAALKRNARFQALMAQRYGIQDMAQLVVDPWCAR